VADVLTAPTGAPPARTGQAPQRRLRRPSPALWRRLRRVAAVVVPFELWDIAAATSTSRLFPGPYTVLQVLWNNLADGTIWYNSQLTFSRGLLGLLIAIGVGVPLAVLLARVHWVDRCLQPLIVATYPVPKLALFPLLILLLGFGAASKVAMVAVECGYPIILTTYAGVQAIDKHYFWLAENVGARPAARFRLMMRAAAPALMASLRLATPIMLVIIVVTELIGESRGLGYLIRKAGGDFEPATALAVVLLLGIIGFVLDRLIVAMTRYVTRFSPQLQL